MHGGDCKDESHSYGYICTRCRDQQRVQDVARAIRDYVRDKFVYGSLDSLNELEIYVNELLKEEKR